MTGYTNPAGFTVSQQINGAQQPTSLTYGGSMAVSSIIYEPWGAISTMCGGQGCAQSQETRQYNSRLQPVLMELGNSSNLTADYCLVYNYYTSVANPTGCAMPSQGTGDNGNIIGKYYQANADTSYSHAGAYTYDGVNRLLTAVATGSQAYNLTYSYDQYGNGTCVMNGSTQGLCPQYSYNSANNHITNTGYNYDAAGDLLWDGGSNYEFDAEGRVKHSYSTGQWQYPTYNALGQRVQDYQGIDPITLTYPRDIFGQRTGAFAQWPSQNWTGWNVYWSQIAGQRLNMGGASAYIDHADVVGSTTMETDPAGGVQWKIAYYPWGQILAQGGIRHSVVFADLDWQVNDPSYPSATREYNDGLGRWLTPDPGGVKVVKLDDPQTWNMYAYVGNNPTSRNDPSGLYTANCNDDVKNCGKQIQHLNEALEAALKSKDPKIRAGAAAYGTLGDKNGVNVTFTKVVDPKHADVTGTTTAQAGTPGFTFNENSNTFQQATQVTLKAGLASSDLEEYAIHEGVHVEDRAAFVNSIQLGGPPDYASAFNRSLNITGRQSEINAYGVENMFRLSFGLPTLNVQDILAHPPYSDNPLIDQPIFGNLGP